MQPLVAVGEVAVGGNARDAGLAGYLTQHDTVGTLRAPERDLRLDEGGMVKVWP